MNKTLTSLTLGFLLLARPLTAEVSALTQGITRAAAELPAGGFIIAETSGGEVTYASAGHPSTRSDLPPEAIIFEIGSITKFFTGLLLAQTVIEGKATLDDPIARHLPADLALDPQVAAITLAQLSAHTSGLPRLPGNFAPVNPVDPYADYTADLLYAFLSGHRPEKPAPQPSNYSNLGVGLLGHILERIHGMSYAELVAAKITTPLGLDDTVITLNPEQAARFATPHSGSVAVSPWTFEALAGAGALRSTAADLILFARELMREDSPLAPAFALARQPLADFGRSAKIGLGFIIIQRNGQTAYHHGGGTGGYRSFLEFEPATGRVTVVLLNNDTLEPGPLVAAAHRPPAAKTEAAARAEVSLAPEELPPYTGIYAIDARARFTVVVDADGRLRVRLTGQRFLPVFYAGEDRFFARAVPAELQFTRDGAGAITGLTLYQNGNELPARRTADAPVILFPTAEELAAYTGRYQLAPGLIFEVNRQAGHLFVKLTGQQALPVFPIRADHFVYDVVEAALTFERDDTHAITAIVLHQHGQNQRAPRLEE